MTSSDAQPSGVGVVDRVVDLPVDRDALWQLISTDVGWRQWLVDEATFDPAGAGSVVVDGVERVVRFDAAPGDDGTSVGFTWWERDDPTSVADVQLRIDDGDRGTTRLTIVEQHLGSGAARSAQSRVDWEVRVCSLWACTVAAALV